MHVFVVCVRGIGGYLFVFHSWGWMFDIRYFNISILRSSIFRFSILDIPIFDSSIFDISILPTCALLTIALTGRTNSRGEGARDYVRHARSCSCLVCRQRVKSVMATSTKTAVSLPADTDDQFVEPWYRFHLCATRRKNGFSSRCDTNLFRIHEPTTLSYPPPPPQLKHGAPSSRCS